MWAFGCFAYELATGKTPFANILDEAGQLEAIISQPHAPISTKHWSPHFSDFIDKCLIKDAKKRWTMAKLLTHHKFFAEMQDSTKVE